MTKQRCATSKLTVDAAARKDAQLGDMQHRHFATVATILRSYNFTAENRRNVCEHFADELRKTNPRFDRARFLRACGVE